MGNITINSNITGGGGGGTGDVSGGSNLTTVGAIPYVSASGVLNQDPTALFWDAANNRLGVGTNLPSFSLDITGTPNTVRVYSGAGVSDSTKMVVRAGAGQSTTNLTEWQDSSGTIVAQFKSSDARLTMGVLTGGSYQASFRAIDFESWYGAQSPFTGPSSGRAMLIGGNAVGLRVASDYGMYWSANAAGSGDAYGSLDTGLSRNAAGVVEVNNGTTGTYRDLILRRSQHNGVTVAALPAAAAGNAGSIQYVTDANATTIGSTVAGGGANKVMVWSDGAAWKIFAS